MHPVIDLSPLLSGMAGNAISVAGILIGGRAEALAVELVTGAEEAGPFDGARVFRDGTVFRKAVDGTLVEIPLSRRIEGVLARGGNLWLGPVTVSVLNGRIARVFVRGGALDVLEIHGETDIEKRCGAASGIERSFGTRLYHYIDRQLVVAWEARDSRLAFVALGPDEWKEARLGAPELLSELMWSFEDLARNGWVEPSSGSQRTRYRRVAALARALNLGTPGEVATGSFLQGDLTPARQRVLIELARTVIPETESAQFPIQTYERLLRHRVKAEAVIGFNRSVLECSIPVLAGVMSAQESVATSLRESLNVVDDWLCRLMDPDGRTFTEADLIAQFGWPDIDVRHQEAAEAWGE